MAITLRKDLNRPLTHDELDENFETLVAENDSLKLGVKSANEKAIAAETKAVSAETKANEAIEKSSESKLIADEANLHASQANQNASQASQEAGAAIIASNQALSELSAVRGQLEDILTVQDNHEQRIQALEQNAVFPINGKIPNELLPDVEFSDEDFKQSPDGIIIVKDFIPVQGSAKTSTSGIAYNHEQRLLALEGGTPQPVNPLPPVNLTMISKTDTSVTLEWEAPKTGPIAVKYEAEINGSMYQTVILGLNHVFEGLTQDTEYSFKIRSIDADNNKSIFTDAIVVKTSQSGGNYVLESTFNLNFKGQWGSVASNYNNIALADSKTAILSLVYNSNNILNAPFNLYNTNDIKSDISISITQGFGGSAAGGQTPSPSNSGVLIDQVYETYWSIDNVPEIPGKLKLSGLTAGKSYHFALLSCESSAATGKTKLKIGSAQSEKSSFNNFGSSVNRANPFNDSAMCVINNVHPNASGEIELEIGRVLGSGLAFLNAIIIQQSNIDKA